MRLNVVIMLISTYDSSEAYKNQSESDSYMNYDKRTASFEFYAESRSSMYALSAPIENKPPIQKLNQSQDLSNMNHKIINDQINSRSNKKISTVSKILTPIFCGIMVASFYYTLPTPFNLISALAMSGPLFASVMRLLFSK